MEKPPASPLSWERKKSEVDIYIHTFRDTKTTLKSLLKYFWAPSCLLGLEVNTVKVQKSVLVSKETWIEGHIFLYN